MAKSKQHRRGVDMNYIQANSPYNDGWTREFYENVEKGIGKQLELFPDLYPPKHIYESPDGGETIYKKKINSDERELVTQYNRNRDVEDHITGSGEIEQEWPGLDAINKEWV